MTHKTPFPAPCTLGIKVDEGSLFKVSSPLSWPAVLMISHSNKFYSPLILPHVWKFFSKPLTDHNKNLEEQRKKCFSFHTRAVGYCSAIEKNEPSINGNVTESKLALLATQQASESERRGVEAKKTLIGESADGEDGRLVPQNNHLIGVWMSGSFMDQRERSNEELKSKGRREREIQWGSKVKGFSVSQKTSPRECPAFGKGILTPSIHRWAGTNYLSRS